MIKEKKIVKHKYLGSPKTRTTSLFHLKSTHIKTKQIEIGKVTKEAKQEEKTRSWR